MVNKAIDQVKRYRDENQQALNDILNRFIRMYRYYNNHKNDFEFKDIFSSCQGDLHKAVELIGEIITGEHDVIVQGMNKEQRWDMFYKEGE